MIRLNAIKQFSSFLVLYVLATALFHLAAIPRLPWWVAATLIALNASVITFLFFSRDRLRLFVVWLTSFETSLMLQFLVVRAYNRAAVILLVFWIVNEILNRPLTAPGAYTKVIVPSLIFLILFAMIIFTLPKEFQY